MWTSEVYSSQFSWRKEQHKKQIEKGSAVQSFNIDLESQEPVHTWGERQTGARTENPHEDLTRQRSPEEDVQVSLSAPEEHRNHFL